MLLKELQWMVIGLGRKLNLNKKPIKEFNAEDWREYRQKRYEKEKGKRLEYQKRYYQSHKSELQKKGRNYYRIKCGLRIEK